MIVKSVDLGYAKQAETKFQSRSTLLPMGAIQPILTAIDRIIPHLPRDRSTAELYLQKLGQTYTNLADFSAATEIYQQTLTFCETGNYSN